MDGTYIVLEPFWNEFLSQCVIYSLWEENYVKKEWPLFNKIMIIYIFLSYVSLKWTAVRHGQVHFFP